MAERERGSATILVLAWGALVVAVAWVITVQAVGVLARHRVESAADLAALAGAESIGRSTVGICPAAEAVARANQVELSDCAISVAPSGRTGWVRVVVRRRLSLPLAGSTTLTASARAGRVPRDESDPAERRETNQAAGGRHLWHHIAVSWPSTRRPG